MLRSSRWVIAAAALAAHSYAQPLRAQWQSNTGPAGAALGAVVGGDVERYVRALALAGVIKSVPWGIRPFGPEDLREMLGTGDTRAHPWKTKMISALSARGTLGAIGFTSINSGFAWGANDGALWQGRGATGAVGGAAQFRWGPISAVAAPAAFATQNAKFPTLTPIVIGVPPGANALYPTIVDLPQRMGDAQYSRFDPGESTLRVRLPAVQIGITTASLGWGSGETFPSIFGANAGGFPHVFVGTLARGLRIPMLGRVSGRYVLGALQQSKWSTVNGSETFIDRDQSGTLRIGTGLSLTFTPSLLRNLELGASRFYHSPYRAAGMRFDAWSKPFEGVFKKGFDGRSGGPGDEGGDSDNQLAAFYARFLFPARGVEASFELFREDHNWDSRDLAQEPENNGAVLASLRAITSRNAARLAVLTIEYFDGDVRPIAKARAQGFLYSHGYLRQGHTQRGQLLGSPIGAGAIAGSRVSWERFSSTGSLRASVQRWRTRSVLTADPEALYRDARAEIGRSHDWILDASLASTCYTSGRSLTFEGGIAWAGVFNFDQSRSNFYGRASWSVF
jgi:hypothetical protein